MLLFSCHSVHEFPSLSKHTLNAFENRVPRTFSPPGHSAFRQVSPHWLKLDHPAHDPYCAGHVVGAMHPAGIAALAIASGSPERAAASMAGVGRITASVAGGMLSSTASPFLADTPKLTLIKRIRATPLSLPSHIAEK